MPPRTPPAAPAEPADAPAAWTPAAEARRALWGAPEPPPRLPTVEHLRAQGWRYLADVYPQVHAELWRRTGGALPVSASAHPVAEQVRALAAVVWRALAAFGVDPPVGVVAVPDATGVLVVLVHTGAQPAGHGAADRADPRDA